MFKFIFVALWLGVCFARTPITVTNEYSQEVQIKIAGAGLGGCEKIMAPNAQETCSCLWGTLDYNFCAYLSNATPPGDNEPSSSTTLAPQTTSSVESEMPEVKSEGAMWGSDCPSKKGMTLLCSDLSSLGNCYDKGYTCTVSSTGMCSCQKI